MMKNRLREAVEQKRKRLIQEISVLVDTSTEGLDTLTLTDLEVEYRSVKKRQLDSTRKDDDQWQALH
ncbi:hypothetical protein [Aureibacillus halotolerans]|uniref:Fur-regulated basic protein A n=1 Tax=Aureibacillus halotolerans TaxID=1508390 RepID=A0A4R6U221_9BACI|nr:hypothetical protein [Aureibacillus halotolerans]TDQ37144.1 hypothetical protein EV213_11423 [Aureibacillus halotolerans]